MSRKPAKSKKPGKSKATAKPPIAYRPCIVTFIDILGFKNIVLRRDPSVIKEIVRLVQWHAGAKREEKIITELGADGMSWTRTVFFSDSVVRIRPYDGEYCDGSLHHEILDLVHAQAELAFRGIFIRGGLTVGKMYQEEDVLFGPAMVRAYDLESLFAKYPRIVIDPDAFEALKKDERLRADHHDLEDELEYLGKLLRQGEDGLYFIDYLGAIRLELDEPLIFPSVLADLKRTIVTNAVGAALNLDVLQKYMWLAKYLNTVAAEQGDCANDTNIIVSETDIPQLESLPRKDSEYDIGMSEEEGGR